MNGFYVLGGCGSFYAISITSDTFKGLLTVKQHKLVTETLKSEIEGIHGLQVNRIIRGFSLNKKRPADKNNISIDLIDVGTSDRFSTYDLNHQRNPGSFAALNNVNMYVHGWFGE
jgi:BolA-like protein